MVKEVQENPAVDNCGFILDSGASDHLINDESLYIDSVELVPPLKIAVAKQGEYIYASKRGIVRLRNDHEITLEDVLFSEQAAGNLMSVKRLQEAGMSIKFDKNGVTISKNGLTVVKNSGMFNNIPIVQFQAYNIDAKHKNNFRLWHERLGHISNGKLLEIKRHNMFSDNSLLNNLELSNEICEPCLNGKQGRLPFKQFKNRTHIKRPLFVVHSDVCGPITPVTLNDKNYFVIFVDQFTHYCVTYLIKHKSDVFNMFKDFVAKGEAHFNLKIVNLYIDNGREYLSNEMRQFCVKKGITYHLTVPHTPQLNGVSERMIRTITEKARAMISGAQLDKSFWGEAVLTATYLINRIPSRAIVNSVMTPYEM